MTGVQTCALPISVMKMCHSSPGAGHPGYDRMYEKMKERYTFNKMYSLVAEYCRQCHSCLEIKGNRPPPAPIGSYPVGIKPFQMVSSDIIGPLTTCHRTGNSYIIVFKCMLTKYGEIEALKAKDAKSVAESFMNCVIKNHTCPEIFYTDNGGEYISKLLKDLCDKWRIKKEIGRAHV